jgi:NTP pyrophosphatase (non-canonical NTP hydrolase)
MALKNKDYEALDLLQEECAEVIQTVSKIRRFGLDSYHPEDTSKRTNIQLLEDEIGDTLLIIEILIENGVIDEDAIASRIESKRAKLMKYTNLFNESE